MKSLQTTWEMLQDLQSNTLSEQLGSKIPPVKRSTDDACSADACRIRAKCKTVLKHHI